MTASAGARQLPLSRLEGKVGGALHVFRELAEGRAGDLWDTAFKLRSRFAPDIQNQGERESIAWWKAFESATDRFATEAETFFKTLDRARYAVMELGLGNWDDKRTDPLFTGLGEILLVAKDLETRVAGLHEAVVSRDPQAPELIGAIVEEIARFDKDVSTSDFLSKLPAGVSSHGVKWQSSFSRQALAERAAARAAASPAAGRGLG